MKKIIKRLKSKTPVYAKILQALSGAVAAIPLYYGTLPEEFKASIPAQSLVIISFIGAVIAFFLQLLQKKGGSDGQSV
jgi:hypothetical protein